MNADKIMKNFRTTPSMCPNCGYFFDAAGGAMAMNQDGDSEILPDMTAPSMGDFSICVSCTSILRFEANNQPRLATEEDFAGAPLAFVRELAQIQKLIVQAQETHGKPPDINTQRN